ncbi:DUF6221 family protein [Nocardia fluminea]|uniref:Uncharacterized protein n=1 Tax=Nocardia fluminea TaxID=134984 RepID=A0A2N3VGZ0_9NOCA|nr:DUF6221 family protein [Nocardia fluminea]PKV80892.1 hypothetical protein ATK86_5329 [Nocardia fluminea]
MSTIEDFITQRLAEDERQAGVAAEARGDHWCADYDGVAGPHGRVGYDMDTNVIDHIANHDPARVLRQVAAVRDILGLAQSAMGAHQADYEPGGTGDEAMYGYRMGAAFAYDPVLKAIAATWSDHPDFQPEWATTDVKRSVVRNRPQGRVRDTKDTPRPDQG